MQDPPVIDLATIGRLRSLGGADGDFLREIVDIFLSDTPARIAELDLGPGPATTEKFLRAAHSIKGSASNIGAFRLQSAAERLETRARESGPSGLGPLVAEVKAEFALARQELARYL